MPEIKQLKNIRLLLTSWGLHLTLNASLSLPEPNEILHAGPGFFMDSKPHASKQKLSH